MCSNLSNYQLKTNSHVYIYQSIYMNLNVTTNQKSTIDTQKIERNSSNYKGRD